MKTHSFKARILILLTLAIIVLLGAFVFSFYRSQQKHMTNEVASKLQYVEELYMGQLNTDANMMGAVLDVLLADEQLKAAMKAEDRKGLFDRSVMIFEKLNFRHGLTHLYFTGPDRVNVLRVHKPDKRGDEINRYTTLQAQKTATTSYGIELGPLGTFTLRVVEPWYDNRQLIGYVELGEEIEHITRKLHDILGVEIYVVIEKKFLDRKGWQTGMRMLGRNADWDRFPSVVMIDQTQDVFPESLAGFLAEEQHTSKVTDVKVSFNDRHYRSRFIHMDDASGRGVGDMVVMTDVTDMVADLRATVLVISVICLAVGGILFILFYIFIAKTEKILEKKYGRK